MTIETDDEVTPVEPPAQRVGDARAHTRVRIPQTMRLDKDRIAAGWSKLVHADPWHGRLPSLASVYEYTRAGGWVPGDWPWYAELPGKGYGYGFALPVLAVLYALALLLYRPSHLLLAVAALGLIVLFV